MPETDDLIDQLTEDLTARRSLSPAIARMLLGLVALATLAGIVAVLGMRPDFEAGHPHPVPLIAALVLMSAGLSVAVALTNMARPAVGAQRGGWQWSVAALGVLPAAALVTAAGNVTERAAMLPPDGPSCLLFGLASSVASILFLTLWLKRGAPTSPERASWLIGIAGGGIGALAIGLCCPLDSIAHIGTWHVAVVGVAAVACRLLLPPILRW